MYMKPVKNLKLKSIWRHYGLFIAGTEAVGALSGFLTRTGTKMYQAEVVKPPLNPPAIVFPVVWAILYALMGTGAAKIWMAKPSKIRTYGLAVFGIQLAMNFLWSIVFFNLQAYGFAFLWLVGLWILILLMIYLFGRVDKTAGWLQVPYLVWVTFAGYLNFMVWMLN